MDIEDFINASQGPTEPSAELREVASILWQTYLALESEGFTEKQALIIIGQIIASQEG